MVLFWRHIGESNPRSSVDRLEGSSGRINLRESPFYFQVSARWKVMRIYTLNTFATFSSIVLETESSNLLCRNEIHSPAQRICCLRKTTLRKLHRNTLVVFLCFHLVPYITPPFYNKLQVSYILVTAGDSNSGTLMFRQGMINNHSLPFIWQNNSVRMGD